MKAKLLLLTALLACAAGVQAKHPRNTAPGQFDYYAVALSWSPAFCAKRGADPEECDSRHPRGFVLHGLWPQFEKGYPESCSTERLPEPVRAKFAGIYASPNLIDHEWSKHGTCSGLSPVDYFSLSDRLHNSIAIPAQFNHPQSPQSSSYNDFVKAFRKANPDMPINGLLPFCAEGGRTLREVHACFSQAGKPVQCSQGEVKRSFSSCRRGDFELQPMR
jgi:ribonuclease T2